VVVFLVEKEEEEETIIISLLSFVEQDSSYLYFGVHTQLRQLFQEGFYLRLRMGKTHWS
jgi:hypothetical protein